MEIVTKAKKLEEMIQITPFIFFKCRNEHPRWPVDFITDNISLLGYHPDEFYRGLLLDDLMFEEDKGRVSKEIIENIHSGVDHFVLEYRFYPKRGEPIWVEHHFQVERDSFGEVSMFHGVLHDINPRKQAEISLQQSELKYQLLVNNSSVGILYIKNSGVILDANPTMITILGLKSIDELYNVNIFESQSLIQSGISDAFRLSLETHQTKTFEHPYASKWGKQIFLSYTIIPIYSKNNDFLGAEAIVEDITRRKLAENQIQQSRDYLDKIINAIPDPIFVKNREHKWVLLNDAFCNFIGYSREMLLGKGDVDFFLSEEVDIFVTNDNSVFETGNENLNEEKITDFHKNIHYILTKKTLYIDPHNGEKLLVGVIRDITKRKKIEEELIKNERLLTKVTESAHDVIVLADSKNRIIYSNQTIERVFGYNSDEILNKTIFDLLPFYDFTTLNNTPKSYKSEGIKKGGKKFPVEITWSAVVFDEQPHYLGMIRDRTEKVKLEQMLEKELEKLKRLLELDSFLLNINELDLIIDTVLVTITAGSGFRFNRGFILLEDLPSKFLKGVSAIGPADPGEAGRIYHNIASQNLTLADLIQNHHENRDVYDQRVKDLVKKIYINPKDDKFFNTIFQNKKIIETKKDNLYPDSYIISLLNNDDLIFIPLIINDGVIGIIIVDNYITRRSIPDEDLELLQLYANRVASAVQKAKLHNALNLEISKTKEANIQITQINNRLIQTEKMAAMGEITSEIAHEIRNPLVSIGGFARALARSIDPEDKNRELLNIIIDESQRLENILSNVLSYARGNRVIAENRSITEAINQAIKLLEYHKQEKNLDLICNFEESFLQDYDYEKMIQVFFNLIKNAMQASEKDGKIEVSVQKIHQRAVIRIKDYGSGIKPEHLDSIFNPFFTTKSQGIGLGLSIVKQIINNHGGEINFITEEGQGTEFIITMSLINNFS